MPRCKGKPWDPNLTWKEIKRSPKRSFWWIYRRLTAAWRGFPQVYIAGAKKCGTTSLFQYLIVHPRVLVPFRKEVKYFSYHLYLGEIWYKANFPRREILQSAITLDATPDYLMHPLFAENVMKVSPSAKVIVLLRDPVRRILSHYFANKRQGYESLSSLEKAIELEPQRIRGERVRIQRDPCHNPWTYLRYGYLEESRYIEHLEHLWKYVPKHRVLVLRSEDLFLRPEEVLHEVGMFLDLEPWRVNIRVYNEGNYQLEEMMKPIIEQLRDYFRPYNERLSMALGRDMMWKV